MAYKLLRNIYHQNEKLAANELQRRLNSEYTCRLGLFHEDNEFFYTLTPEIYDLIIESHKLEKKISDIKFKLPSAAVDNFIEVSMIDDIVQTNEIEGVHSSHKQVSEAIAYLRQNDKNHRFCGIAESYDLICNNSQIDLKTCSQIRKVYDNLILDEVLRADESSVPDGKYFRRGSVSVYGGAGNAVHAGLVGEEQIIKWMKCSLAFVNNSEIYPIVRSAIFHYLLGFIHPFYDGNGRLARFISSYVLAQNYEPIVGLRLSGGIMQNLNNYYKAFKVCDHSLNCGDLTPFLLEFCKVVVNSMKNTVTNLTEAYDTWQRALERFESAGINQGTAEWQACKLIIEQSLFSDYGATPGELAIALNLTRQTVYKRILPLKDNNLIRQQKIGHKTYYTMII